MAFELEGLADSLFSIEWRERNGIYRVKNV